MSDDKSGASSKRAKMAAALDVEREGYVRAGNKDRIAEVEAAIKALRGEKPAGRRAPEVPAATAAPSRRS